MSTPKIYKSQTKKSKKTSEDGKISSDHELAKLIF
jgi:hypothetical protein